MLTNPVDAAMVESINASPTSWVSRPSPNTWKAKPPLAKLHELGVDYAQGYLVGRPAPLAERLGEGRPIGEVGL
jgi:hypothetical protein